jgi:hypothetical protein
MINGKTPPVLSMLNSAEDIFRMRKKYRFVLLWTITASIWIIASSALIILDIVLGKQYATFALDAFVALIIVIGIPLFITSFFAVNDSAKGSVKLENFIKEFYPIWVKVRFELSVSSEGTLEQKISTILGDMDNDFKKYILNPSIKKDSAGIAKNFTSIIKGKKQVATIKVMEKNSPEDALDINQFQIETNKVAKLIRAKSAMLIVVLMDEKHSSLKDINFKEDRVNWVRSIIVSYDGSNFIVEKVTPLRGKPLISS